MRKFSYLNIRIDAEYISKGRFDINHFFLAVPKIEGEYFYIPFYERKKDPLVFQLQGYDLIGEFITLEATEIFQVYSEYTNSTYKGYSPSYIYKMIVLARPEEIKLGRYLCDDTLSEIYL